MDGPCSIITTAPLLVSSLSADLKMLFWQGFEMSNYQDNLSLELGGLNSAGLGRVGSGCGFVAIR